MTANMKPLETYAARRVYLNVYEEPLEGIWCYDGNDVENLVQMLFDLSLTHAIVEMEGNDASCIDFTLEPDPSGGTNLDADIIELIVEWVRRR